MPLTVDKAGQTNMFPFVRLTTIAAEELVEPWPAMGACIKLPANAGVVKVNNRQITASVLLSILVSPAPADDDFSRIGHGALESLGME
jgi:hypothetical protein